MLIGGLKLCVLVVDDEFFFFDFGEKILFFLFFHAIY